MRPQQAAAWHPSPPPQASPTRHPSRTREPGPVPQASAGTSRTALLGAHELASALASGWLVAHYQPIVQLPDGHPVAIEALLRIRHPGRGLLHPTAFLPVAEATGEIIGFGAWILREACVEAARWGGPQPPTVNVNVSAYQLAHPGFSGAVADALAESGLPGEQLCLELTESALLAHTPALRTIVGDLVDLGVHLAVDDFGVGFSSLARLQDWPARTLKIDRRFTTAVTTVQGRRLWDALLAMAHALDVELVGEGVETAEQAALLHELGCDTVQGFLFGYPVPAAELG